MKIKKNLALRNIEGKIYVVDTETSYLHCLNETATKIFEYLMKKYTVEEIISKLVSEYDISYTQAKNDVLEFISQLKQKKMVE